MVKSMIGLGHIVSKNGVEINKGKVDLISKLPAPGGVILVRPRWVLPLLFQRLF